MGKRGIALVLSPAKKRSLEIWLGLVTLLVQRDLRIRYRGSVLGYLWSMMNPLLYMLILTLVFSQLMKFNVPHLSIFILSGILTWNLFQQSLMIGVNSIVANGSLLRKVKVPSSLFPAASVCSVLVNFVLALGPYVLIAFGTGMHLSGWIFILPLLLIPYLVFIYGLVLLVATLNVSYRDVGHVLEPLLHMTFYATPVVYPIERLPEFYRHLIGLNPVVHYMEAFRHVLYDGTPPTVENLATITALAVVSLLIGTVVYRKSRDNFIYNL